MAQNDKNSQTDLDGLEKMGMPDGQPRPIACLPIIGQIEGHMALSDSSKTTKYEHILPMLVDIEQNDKVQGLLLLLNTVGAVSYTHLDVYKRQALAFSFRDNRAFCKYICPLTVFLKPTSYFSLLRVKCDEEKCVSCGKCRKVCPMNVNPSANSRKRENATECILCLRCVEECPKKALKL